MGVSPFTRAWLPYHRAISLMNWLFPQKPLVVSDSSGSGVDLWATPYSLLECGLAWSCAGLIQGNHNCYEFLGLSPDEGVYQINIISYH